MAERIVNGYARLFEIRLLHHFWLDEGATVFDLMPQARRDQRLLSYDMRSFFSIRPTVATAKALNGFRCVYKDTALGCIVAVPNGAVLPLDALFEFILAARSAALYNYTALTLRPQEIYDLYHQVENKTYRYKENAPFLTNLTGASRGAGASKALFLSKEIPALAADDKVESLVISNNALLQLTSDQPGAGTQELNAAAANLPVFVHQGDVPNIVPPAGFIGAPPRGVMLSQEITDDVFALVRLSAIRANDGDFSFLDANGRAKPTAPIFQIHFKNRSTIWKYLDRRTGTLKSAESDPLPLSYFGNAGTKQKASPDTVKAVKSGARTVQLTSEIFI